MFGRVPKIAAPFLRTRPNISECHSEISTRVPFCITQTPRAARHQHPLIQKGTRVLISLWDSLMFGRVPKNTAAFLGTRPNISESHSEISSRVPFCIVEVAGRADGMEFRAFGLLNLTCTKHARCVCRQHGRAERGRPVSTDGCAVGRGARARGVGS